MREYPTRRVGLRGQPTLSVDAGLLNTLSPHPERRDGPVLVLGAGINGCAVARELALNGVPVWLVERNDLAFGATSRSSRLIHGGLRYLEYGEVRLVRESLAERTRLLRLAPHFVRELRLVIPIRRRFGGLVSSVLRFLSASRLPLVSHLAGAVARPAERGLWLVRAGLWLYDRFTARSGVAAHGVARVSPTNGASADPQVSAASGFAAGFTASAGGPAVPAGGEPQRGPAVRPDRFRWVCDYTDAQMVYPERFVVALLADAKRLAAEQGGELHVRTWSTVERNDDRFTIIDSAGRREPIQPSVVVNATGAWGDITLEELHVSSPRMFGGTRGSHFISFQPRLRGAIGDRGIYAEAGDGRMVFVLPFESGVLVGTTDERFYGSPDQAVATEEELSYLIDMVNDVVAGADLTRADVAAHYSGVRPLPWHPRGSTAAISRDHSISIQQCDGIPTLTLIGGKLTTCRAFAELAADRILTELARERRADSHDLPVAGNADYPNDVSAVISRLAERYAFPQAHVAAVWRLLGTNTEPVLADATGGGRTVIAGTDIPRACVRWIIEHEWVTKLEDLVERRLLLIFHPDLSEATLHDLAQCLVEVRRVNPDTASTAVTALVERLAVCYGRVVPCADAVRQGA